MRLWTTTVQFPRETNKQLEAGASPGRILSTPFSLQLGPTEVLVIINSPLEGYFPDESNMLVVLNLFRSTTLPLG